MNEFFDRAMGGLLGTPQTYGGLLSAQDQETMKRQAQMAMAAQLLAASGPSDRPTGFGQALGSSIMAGQQAQNAAGQDMLQAMLLKSRLQGKDREDPATVAEYKFAKENGFKGSFEEWKRVGSQGNASNAANLQEYDAAKASGFKGSYLDFVRAQAQARHVSQPQEPLVAIQLPDGRSVLVPRHQAVGQTPASPREGALPTEGERTAANYLGRMEAAESLLGDYKPTMSDYVTAQQVMAGGPVRSGAANFVLSPEGQQYYQAAADWVRAKLRKESGAVISPEEMAQEIKTYFPVPGDSQGTIEQKRQARLQAQQGMRQMGGRATAQPKATADASSDDPLGILGK